MKYGRNPSTGLEPRQHYIKIDASSVKLVHVVSVSDMHSLRDFTLS